MKALLGKCRTVKTADRSDESMEKVKSAEGPTEQPPIPSLFRIVRRDHRLGRRIIKGF
jgi:hypothetical protein